MTTFFTSDLHFGHENVIKYCNRPYANAATMDEELIQNWNSEVAPTDTVYILGDVFFHKLTQSMNIMSRLNGVKHLILGNHDKVIAKNPQLMQMFDHVHPELYHTVIDGVEVALSHYPLLSWKNASRGAFMLHGHCHGGIEFDPAFRRLDVGVDVHDYKPISFERIRNKLEKIEPLDARSR